jgi:hypothetical protein
MTMRVLDDYLPADAFARLLAAVSAADFPWQRTPILFPPPFGLDAAYNVQEVHGFLQHKPGFRHVSERLPVLEALLRQLDARDLFKVKLNRTLQREKSVVYGWHRDTRRPGATTGVYYLNTNDGHTAFEDGRRVDSVANRLVLFDARLRHSGASCTDTPERLVLNLNFMPRPGSAGDFSA